MQDMGNETLALLCLGLVVVAFLYSSVGHAGASGYIATMSLFGLAANVIKPTALVLNIIVALVASWQFWRAGHFRWRLFWPFALASIPFAFLGGRFNLPGRTFKILVGVVLLLSAVRFFLDFSRDGEFTAPGKPASFLSGGLIGLLSGLTGTGGGIFLTPLMIFMRWAETKAAAAVSAGFILVNSLAGLAGNYSKTGAIPGLALPMAVSVAVGGITGSYLGSQRFSSGFIRKLLAVVLVIAGLKLIFT